MLELNQCIGTPIYIGRYDDVADVSYRQNSTDIYQPYLLIKVLRCCFVWSIRKPNALYGAFGNPSCYLVSDSDSLTQMLCPVPSAHSLHAYRPLCNSSDKMLYDVTFTHRFWRGKHRIVCKQTRLRAFVLVGCFIKVSLG